MLSNRLSSKVVLVAFALLAATAGLFADEIRRTDALKIAESYVQHRWYASPRNLLHGRDRAGVEVHTSDRDPRHGFPLDACWRVDAESTGVAYKWGGFDTLETFDAGIRSGKAAGDIYTPEKRRLDDRAISSAAVGIDCSGFVCRCWKLRRHYSTYSLGLICRRLPSASDLQPADIMNESKGHVLLFVKFLDGGKRRALFYEAAPFSKTVATEREVTQMVAAGYVPMRYRGIR